MAELTYHGNKIHATNTTLILSQEDWTFFYHYMMTRI
jgi:hypothetical protein